MRISCKACGANLKYIPNKQIAICEHCGNTYKVEDIEFDDSSYDECEEYTCSSCGAKILALNKTTLTSCVYCGGKEFVKAKANKEYMLTGIIPFKIDREEFKSAYIETINDILDCDKEFIQKVEDAKITGVYLPYSFANSFYKKDHSKDLFDLLEEVIPFNFKELHDMHPIYLDGFYAENIKTKMEDNYIKTKDNTFFWVPIWIAEVEYKNERYYIVMNGQTKEMAGLYRKFGKDKNIEYKKQTNKIIRQIKWKKILKSIEEFCIIILMSVLIFKGLVLNSYELITISTIIFVIVVSDLFGEKKTGDDVKSKIEKIKLDYKINVATMKSKNIGKFTKKYMNIDSESTNK